MLQPWFRADQVGTSSQVGSSPPGPVAGLWKGGML